MRLIQYEPPEPGASPVLSIVWTWLPTWIGFSAATLQRLDETVLQPAQREGLTDADLGALQVKLFDAIVALFPAKGMREALESIARIELESLWHARSASSRLSYLVASGPLPWPRCWGSCSP